MVARLHVSINIARCCGYGGCAVECAEVYKIDEDGFSYVESELVPEGLEEQARAGADACPEGAITLTDDPNRAPPAA